MGDRGDRKSMLHADETFNGRTIELPVGETLEICLSENRTTGFKWEIVANGEPICRIQDDRYEAGRSVGQGGKHLWRFRAHQTGSAEIELRYRRPWEKRKAANTFRLCLQVYEQN